MSKCSQIILGKVTLYDGHSFNCLKVMTLPTCTESQFVKLILFIETLLIAMLGDHT